MISAAVAAAFLRPTNLRTKKKQFAEFALRCVCPFKLAKTAHHRFKRVERLSNELGFAILCD